MFNMEDGTAFDYFSKLGSSVNAYTTYNLTCYEVYSSTYFKENLNYLLDYVQTPYFTNELVNNERGIITEEIKMYEDMPDWQCESKLREAVYKIHPRRVDIGGTVSEIMKITKEDLYTCYNNFYSPNNMFLLMVGNFDYVKASSIVHEAIDSIPNKDTIKEVLTIINENDSPEVIQQYSVPTSNWSELSNLMKGFSIYQANFELRYGLINSCFPSKLLYTYVVGHGMYVRVDVLKQIGGFETKYWCEDIYMSYVLRNKNISIYPLKTLEIMQ